MSQELTPIVVVYKDGKAEIADEDLYSTLVNASCTRAIDLSQPWWLVLNMSRMMRGDRFGTNRRSPFAHATLESAEAECRWLARRYPGQRFAVFCAATSYKIEIQDPVEDSVA